MFCKASTNYVYNIGHGLIRNHTHNTITTPPNPPSSIAKNLES